MWMAIEDYAIVGDCRSAALVSKTGSIDWLCWPRFDSPSMFAAILDPRAGGRFGISPASPFTVSRRYVGDSAVLETTFETGSGIARLTDLMPVASESDKAHNLWPDHELLRDIECVAGTVDLDVLFDPRPNYGRTVPRLVDQKTFGWVWECGNQVIGLRTDVPLTVVPGGGLSGRIQLRSGQRSTLSVTYDQSLPLVQLPSGGAASSDRIARSVEWWEGWMNQCHYDGPYGEQVRRSAITLKLLTYAPSGAVIAAPTTSLPEAIGGERNWDYRYCWLRDAALTLRVFADLGFATETEAFISWLLHATRLTWPELQVLYDVYGEARLPERHLDHLSGYQRSVPVRVGNAAADQLQLDTYGEVVDAAWQYAERGGRLDRTTARALAGFGESVIRRWRDPDEGIWEPRSGAKHHTHSKAMCWIALDRLARLCERGIVRGDADRYARVRDEVREAIETHGYNARLGSYVSVFGGEAVDASLLMLSLLGYSDPRSDRMRGTLRRVRERLGDGGLLYRYRDEDDGLTGHEGAFGICSFWGVAACALEGDLPTARAELEQVLSYGNDLGLFAEEMDATTGAALGNFPQAFTHVGLINAVLTIEQQEQAAARA
ncbi:MAG TPA: glycoside hydrolase family 15 protein [Vicinamibacterales bacterium]